MTRRSVTGTALGLVVRLLRQGHHAHRDTGTPGHRDTGTPGHRDTGTPGHRELRRPKGWGETCRGPSTGAAGDGQEGSTAGAGAPAVL